MIDQAQIWQNMCRCHGNMPPKRTIMLYFIFLMHMLNVYMKINSNQSYLYIGHWLDQGHKKVTLRGNACDVMGHL